MVLGWISRLLYPFYEKQLREKKNTVMGYPPPQFHFYEINAFQTFKLGSDLLSLPFTMANAFGQIILCLRSQEKN